VIKTPTGSGQALRQRAENNLRVHEAVNPENLSPSEIKQLFHELRVHQIELEVQNEELRRTEHELECSRARYFDLYDLAPVGYLTLSEQGLIKEANLAAATMFGVVRSALVKLPISQIILKEDQNTYYLCRREILKTGKPQACELRMVKGDGTVFWTCLEIRANQDTATTSEQASEGEVIIYVVLSDITERKRADEESIITPNASLKWKRN